MSAHLDWYKAEIVFRAPEALVDRLRSAVTGQELVEVSRLEVSKVNDLQLLEEPAEAPTPKPPRGT